MASNTGIEQQQQAHTNGHGLDQHPGPNLPAAKPHQATVSQVYDPQFFKVANPGPLGLISFALTTFVLGLYQCGAGWVAARSLSLHRTSR